MWGLPNPQGILTSHNKHDGTSGVGKHAVRPVCVLISENPSSHLTRFPFAIPHLILTLCPSGTIWPIFESSVFHIHYLSFTHPVWNSPHPPPIPRSPRDDGFVNSPSS